MDRGFAGVPLAPRGPVLASGMLAGTPPWAGSGGSYTQPARGPAPDPTPAPGSQPLRSTVAALPVPAPAQPQAPRPSCPRGSAPHTRIPPAGSQPCGVRRAAPGHPWVPGRPAPAGSCPTRAFPTRAPRLGGGGKRAAAAGGELPGAGRLLLGWREGAGGGTELSRQQLVPFSFPYFYFLFFFPLQQKGNSLQKCRKKQTKQTSILLNTFYNVRYFYFILFGHFKTNQLRRRRIN